MPVLILSVVKPLWFPNGRWVIQCLTPNTIDVLHGSVLVLRLALGDVVPNAHPVEHRVHTAISTPIDGVLDPKCHMYWRLQGDWITKARIPLGVLQTPERLFAWLDAEYELSQWETRSKQ